MPDNITYDAATLTYTVRPGAATADIRSVIKAAPLGATILFAAGEHHFTQRVDVNRGDITLRGESRDLTTIVIDYSSDTEGIKINGGGIPWKGTLPETITAGSHTLVLPAGHKIAAGDYVELQQPNDDSLMAYGPYQNVMYDPEWNTSPLRESIARVISVSGNVATLEHEIAFDMAGGTATVAKLNMLKNVTVSDLTITYPDSLGEPDDDYIYNALPGRTKDVALMAIGTVGLDIHNVAVLDATSSSTIIRRSIEPTVDNYLADGAFNKGGSKNGYALTIEEVFYGHFTNLDLLNTRHSFLFGGWNAEAFNTVHIRTANRDVNYHGGPDHSNTVIVDDLVYRDGSKSWVLVGGGGADLPYTDISKNVNLFVHAVGGIRDDIIFGVDTGADLDGGIGNDMLIGGAGNDILTGNKGNDKITGGAGADTFVIRPGDGYVEILDFNPAEGDRLLLEGFGYYNAFGDLKFKTQDSTDTKLSLYGPASILLRDILPGQIASANVVIDHDLHGLPAGQVFLGTKNDDTLNGGDGYDDLRGGTGNDHLNGGGGNDYIEADEGDDVLHGDAGDDELRGEYGDDTLYGDDGIDVLSGSRGHDTLYGGEGNDNISGGDDADILHGDGGSDYMYGDGGDDVIYGESGENRMWGGDGNDTIHGAEGNDGLWGDNGNDTLYAYDGADSLYAGAGDDLIFGGAGVDKITGGAGFDDITTGEGSDRLMLDALPDVADIVRDFDALGDSGLDIAPDRIDMAPLFDNVLGLHGLTLQQALDNLYIVLGQDGANMTVAVDPDGAAGAAAPLAAFILQNVSLDDFTPVQSLLV